MRLRRTLLAVFGLMAAVAPASAADVDHGALARASLDAYLRPGHARLADAATQLHADISTLCDAPSADALAKARAAFGHVATDWSFVEPVRFGPIAEGHRFERIFFWPDNKGIARRQVAGALKSRSPGVTEPDALLDKSVGLQGLPALEILLFDKGSDTLATEPGFRCAYARSAAAALAKLARETEQGVGPGAEFAKGFLHPGADGARYRSPPETTLELVKAMAGGIEIVRDQKLARPMGQTPETARPLLAPFTLSGLSFKTMAGNLEGARALFVDGGFAALIDAREPGMSQSILFDLDRAIETLKAIDMPVDRAMRDEAMRGKLSALMIGLGAAERLMRDEIGAAADLAFGFNSLDGD